MAFSGPVLGTSHAGTHVLVYVEHVSRYLRRAARPVGPSLRPPQGTAGGGNLPLWGVVTAEVRQEQGSLADKHDLRLLESVRWRVPRISFEFELFCGLMSENKVLGKSSTASIQ